MQLSLTSLSGEGDSGCKRLFRVNQAQSNVTIQEMVELLVGAVVFSTNLKLQIFTHHFASLLRRSEMLHLVKYSKITPAV